MVANLAFFNEKEKKNRNERKRQIRAWKGCLHCMALPYDYCMQMEAFCFAFFFWGGGGGFFAPVGVVDWTRALA